MSENYALHYERFHPDTPEHTEFMTALMVSEIEPFISDRSGSFLDIGCGFGYAMLAAKRLGFRAVSGIDISPQQITRTKQNGLDAEAVTDTPSWLSKHKAKFSVISLFDVLEHIQVKDQIAMVRAIYASLAPGGRLILQVPNANAILAARWRSIDFTHHSSFTEYSLGYVLRNAGFEDIRLDGEKGLEWFPKRFWNKYHRKQLRKYIIRWCWMQIFKAELPHESLGEISFELNLRAVAIKQRESGMAVAPQKVLVTA